MIERTVDDLRDIAVGLGTPVVPVWPPGEASETWRETEWRSFSDDSGAFFGGGWEGEPGTLRLDPYPYDEVCVMIEGAVALVDVHGGRREFRAGDAFFVPRGFRGVWETLEPARKVFVAFAPPSS
ncbi:cupin domain-containing protein [Streptosporangium sp. NPDC051022]|uniref:cupin domain-containing protein n=1 Tax=Streptosporangium sp. NPDC051022 TaxID=3155752 RepID=UPI00343BA938